MLNQILLAFAFVFAIIAALFVTRVERASLTIHFGWLAVAFWILATLLGAFGLR